MGFREKFWPSSSSSSSSSPVQSPVSPWSPSSPQWSPSTDYTYGSSPTSPSTSRGLAQSYYDEYREPPPPSYQSQGNSNFNESPVNIRMPAPFTSHPGTIYNPTDSWGESPLKVLEDHDIVILLDDSNSMMRADGPSGVTRWDQAWNALETLVRVGSRYDRDGIEIHFLNKRGADKKVKNETDLQRLRRKVQNPDSNTCSPIADRLDTLLLDYQRKTGDSPRRSGVKKRIFLVITDGAPTDAPEYPIVRTAEFFHQRMFPLDQVGIQFIQVGNDPGAQEFLEHLDENLASDQNTRDIVDTIKSNGNDLTGDALIKALTGGFNRKQDRIGERCR